MTCNCNNNIESNAAICNESPCPACGATSGSCGCTTGVAASVAPYYNQAEGCQESHVQVRIQNQYVTGLSVANPFNIPACGGRVTLVIPGLQVIAIGTYIWNPIYGYLKVISFDYAASTIIVENECQDGNASPGMAVLACSLFTVVDAPTGIDNPCTNNAVSDGTLMVCKSGVMQALDATAAGQVPVSLDAGTNEVEFQTVDITPSICTELTADLGLIIGNVGPYTITVTTTNFFVAGDLIIIGGRPDRFTVNNILSLTQFTAALAPAPVGMETIPAGTAVCLAPCCEQLTKDLTDTYTSVLVDFTDRRVNGNAAVYDQGGVQLMQLPGAPTAAVVPGTNLALSNPSLTKIMKAIVNVTVVMALQPDQSNIDYNTINFKHYYNFTYEPIGGGVFINATVLWRDYNEGFHLSQHATDIYREGNISFRFDIPANNQLRFASKSLLTLITQGPNTANIATNSYSILVNAFGVALD